MKTAQIEWVSGSIPETSAIKLITFCELSDGTTHVAEGAFYADDEDSAPCWHFANGKEVTPDKAEVIAWADMPLPYGFAEPAKTNEISFNNALEAIKSGLRVRRSSWLDGWYLWLLPAAEVKAEWCREPRLKRLAEQNGGSIQAEAAIRWNIGLKVVTGWSPTTEDLFATDWAILTD